MKAPITIKAVQEKEQEENDKLSLFYNLTRTDYLLKLLEEGITEDLQIQTDGKTARPVHLIQKLTPEMVEERREKLLKFKEATLEKLGITKIEV